MYRFRKEEADPFLLEMLANNQPQALLPYSLDRDGDGFLLTYTRAGKRPLDEILEEARGLNFALDICLKYLMTLKDLEAYFIFPTSLDLKLSRIFWDGDKVYLLCRPDASFPENGEGQPIIKEILAACPIAGGGGGQDPGLVDLKKRLEMPNYPLSEIYSLVLKLKWKRGNKIDQVDYYTQLP